MSPLLVPTDLPYGLHIKRTSHSPPRGLSAGLWVLTAANAAGTIGFTCLPKHGGARYNKFPSNDWPTLLNFRDRTPERTDREAIEFLGSRSSAVSPNCQIFPIYLWFVAKRITIGNQKHFVNLYSLWTTFTINYTCSRVMAVYIYYYQYTIMITIYVCLSVI
jgi:hypothetical protein